MTSTFQIIGSASPIFSSAASDTPSTPYSFNSQASTASPATSMIDPDLIAMSQAPNSAAEANCSSGQLQEAFELLHRQMPSTSSTYISSTSSYAASNSIPPVLLADSLYQPATIGQPSMEGRGVLYRGHKRSRSNESASSATSSIRSRTSMPNASTGPQTPYSPYLTMPLTPESLGGFEDVSTHAACSFPQHREPPYFPDSRPFSVLQSMLIAPVISYARVHSPALQPSPRSPRRPQLSKTYGYDLGKPDLDTPQNDDYACMLYTPQSETMDLDENCDGDEEPESKCMAFGPEGYYEKPVPISLSRSLEPLPPLLRENPMNLLYFHHFINHTARILVPHDCEQNPFRRLFPKMAISDSNILKLMLAFSASHRARLLNHPEPKTRIASYVADVFPRLRAALDQSPTHVTNATLAPALMLASLEIVSPNTFDVRIGWQNHLRMARQMILTRLTNDPQSLQPENDEVAYFLCRWFGYLDVLGSLSGNKNDIPLASFYWCASDAFKEGDYQIDCLTGLTNRCIGLLARIAELAKQCEQLRIDENGDIREGWQPDPDVVAQAVQIRAQLEEGIHNPSSFHGCPHLSESRPAHSHSPNPHAANRASISDAEELLSTNEMFHYGGLIHLHRRVFGKASSDPEVQHAVRQIMRLLDDIAPGSTAEACVLFPIFAAGCDALDEGAREKIMGRLRGVEGFGIAQIERGRRLLERVWETGKPWESLVEGEFFG